MPDILFMFPVFAPVEKVFDCISTPQGLNTWWTKSCAGEPRVGSTYSLDFGPSYQWKAKVMRCSPGKEFELLMLESDTDWNETKVGFDLQPKDNFTEVQFYHKGWRETNEHFRTSGFCWAMYLRLMKLNAESGEIVSYEKRLDA